MAEETKGGDAGGKGGDAPTIEELQKQNTELLSRATKAEDAAKDFENKFEMTKDERAEERKKRQDEAEKNGQLEEAKKLYQEELAEKDTKIEAFGEERETFESYKAKAEQWDKYNTERRSELLESIPEDARGKYQNADLSILEERAALAGHKPGTFKGSGTKISSGNPKWSEMTETEKGAYKLAHPEEASKMIAAEVANESRW